MTNGCRIAGKCHRSLYPAAFDMANITLPETSIAAENWWLEDYFTFGIAHFQWVSLGDCRIFSFEVIQHWHNTFLNRHVLILSYFGFQMWAPDILKLVLKFDRDPEKYLPTRKLFFQSSIWGAMLVLGCVNHVESWFTYRWVVLPPPIGSVSATRLAGIIFFLPFRAVLRKFGALFLTTYPPFAPGNTAD